MYASLVDWPVSRWFREPDYMAWKVAGVVGLCAVLLVLMVVLMRDRWPLTSNLERLACQENLPLPNLCLSILRGTAPERLRQFAHGNAVHSLRLRAVVQSGDRPQPVTQLKGKSRAVSLQYQTCALGHRP